MFPSPNCNDDNPFDSLLKIRSSSSSSFSSSFLSHQNPNSSLLFNFPSPFLDEHESPLNQIFFQNQNQNQNQNHDHDQDLGKSSKMKEIDRNPSAAAAAPPRRRRTGKKDRHSKICTAQGIRDRRMRLSLQVARKFFDLQDMLGYDKASKTIEWLFTQSKKAIKELVDDYQTSPPPNNSDVKSESFLSECEDRMSGIEEINSNAVISPATGAPAEILKPSTTRPNARESREKARARARSRTREKMMVKRLHFSEDHCFKPNPSPRDDNHHHNVIIPFEGVDQEEIRVSPYQLSDVGMIEKFLGNSSSSTSCPISEYHCGGAAATVSDYGDPNGGSLMGVIGNWDVLSNERSNCFQYSVVNMNQVTFAGNLNSVYSATSEFP